MLVIMCGLPAAGKSTFVDLLRPQLGECHVIRPSDWYPPDLEEMLGDDRAAYQIACWEHALDKATALLPSTTPQVPIILDTCGSSPDALRALIGVARLHKHSVCAIVVGGLPSTCAARMNNRELIQKYASKLPSAVRFYKQTLDQMHVVREGSLAQWSDAAARIAVKLKTCPTCHNGNTREATAN